MTVNIEFKSWILHCIYFWDKWYFNTPLISFNQQRVYVYGIILYELIRYFTFQARKKKKKIRYFTCMTKKAFLFLYFFFSKIFDYKCCISIGLVSEKIWSFPREIVKESLQFLPPPQRIPGKRHSPAKSCWKLSITNLSQHDNITKQFDSAFYFSSLSILQILWEG